MKEIRKAILRASHLGGDGNLQSCFSSVEILWTLYDKVLRIDAGTDWFLPHDRFVLSKGQSTLALMAVLAYKQFIPMQELDTFCAFGSRISMQADRTKFPRFVENSAGSLGHGFPMAVGMAWASKIKGTNEMVYSLAGDGEMNEGTMWEAAIFAASERLSNLILIVDDNDSVSRMIDMGDMKKKLEAFGFDTYSVDGHSLDNLYALFASFRTDDKPKAVLAKTVRGYGSVTMMRDPSWFHRWPDDEELDTLTKEVDSFA